MLDPTLYVLDGVTGVALIPTPVEVLGDRAKLDDQSIGEIFGLRLSPLLPPQMNEVSLVTAHDHPRIRTSDEASAI
jgi:hypothetical protein